MPWWAWLYVTGFSLFSVMSMWDDVQQRRPHMVARSLLLFGTGLAGALAYWFAPPSPTNARWLALLMAAGIVALVWDLSEPDHPQRRAATATADAANPTDLAVADDADDADDDPSRVAIVIFGIAVFLPSYIWGTLLILAAWRAHR
jgi:hypothetical protein